MNSERREIAIQLSGVKKMYKLGQIGGGTLKADLQSWWARKRGKEDPNTKIGEERLIGQTFMALNGIDLTVYKGEALGIIGGNGAGKSTLLKLLSRVTAPTEGRIDLYGRVASMLEVGTGFNGEMTGRENIYMNGAILGMTKAEIDAKMEDIIEFSEVRDFIDTPVKRYSSGMYVKLAFSVAAHLDSEIMIMDEVLAVGDMAFQKKCLDKMRDVANKEGRTVLYVSHNMNTIRQLCDRCIVLEKGRIIFEGQTSDAIQIYLGKEVEEKSEIYYTEKNHEKWCKQKIRIQKLRFIDNVASLYCGNPIRMEITLSGLMNAANLRMRLVLLSQESEVIAMAISSNQFDINKNSNTTVHVDLDTTRIATGKYFLRASIFEMDDFGNHEYVCVVNNFAAFKLHDTPSLNYGMNWDQKSWGYFSLPHFEVKINENCNSNLDHLQ